MFGTHDMKFSFPNARLLRFRFASNELKLTLIISKALKTLSVMAKWLVLSCKSTAPLALDHLSLYGQDRLVISSLRIASARAVYLNGPATDKGSNRPRMSYQLPPSFQHGSPWRFQIFLDQVAALYSGKRGGGRGRKSVQKKKKEKVCAKPPSIGAPNLRFLFFPTRKMCNAPTLAALRQDYPALPLYCVVDRSFDWHRKGVCINNGPLEHWRRAKSGVLREEFDEEKKLKNVREKMHSVNRKLVEGYSVEEDEAHMFKYKGRF
ncbi:unnamed protein product [Closterium sp. Naga37s-1]|nr:unnamed protein product [Closterium sp. Naga37s-1]